MIADKMVGKLKNREDEIKTKYFDDEISKTKYIYLVAALFRVC